METPAKSPPTPARNPRSGGKEGRREGGTERGGAGGCRGSPGPAGRERPGGAEAPVAQSPSGGAGSWEEQRERRGPTPWLGPGRPSLDPGP